MHGRYFRIAPTEVVDNKAFDNGTNGSIGAVGTHEKAQDFDHVVFEVIVVFVLTFAVLREETLVRRSDVRCSSFTIASKRSHLTRADGMVELLEALLIVDVVCVEVEVFPFVRTSAFFARIVRGRR